MFGGAVEAESEGGLVSGPDYASSQNTPAEDPPLDGGAVTIINSTMQSSLQTPANDAKVSIGYTTTTAQTRRNPTGSASATRSAPSRGPSLI
jgi:hypothetical protein